MKKTTLILVFGIALAIVGSAGNIFAAQAQVAWNPDVSQVAGYKVYCGLSSGNYASILDAGNNTTYTLQNLAASTYYIAVTAYDSSNNQSGFSPELVVNPLMASAGLGGSIVPIGTFFQSQGSSQTFTITPIAGYQVVNVLVDGASVGAVRSYTFSNITTNHMISATFSLLPVTGVKVVVTSTNNATVSWTAVTGITSYKVYFGNNTPVTVNGTSYTLTNLQSGTDYNIRVTALDAYGNESTNVQQITSWAPGGYTLWSASGQAAVQELDINDQVIPNHTHTFSNPGFVPVSFTATNGMYYLLWVNKTTRLTILWVMNDLSGTTGTYTAYSYGPWWNAQDPSQQYAPLYFHTPDNVTYYFLWTTSNHLADLWLMNNLSGYSDYRLYGPLWNSTDASKQHLPLNIVWSGTTGYFLWDTSLNLAELWAITSLNPNATTKEPTGTKITYGPWSGYVALTMNPSVDGKCYMAWLVTSTNQMDLWIMNTWNGSYSDWRLFSLTGYTPVGFFKQ